MILNNIVGLYAIVIFNVLASTEAFNRNRRSANEDRKTEHKIASRHTLENNHNRHLTPVEDSEISHGDAVREKRLFYDQNVQEIFGLPTASAQVQFRPQRNILPVFGLPQFSPSNSYLPAQDSWAIDSYQNILKWCNSGGCCFIIYPYFLPIPVPSPFNPQQPQPPSNPPLETNKPNQTIIGIPPRFGEDDPNPNDYYNTPSGISLTPIKPSKPPTIAFPPIKHQPSSSSGQGSTNVNQQRPPQVSSPQRPPQGTMQQRPPQGNTQQRPPQGNTQQRPPQGNIPQRPPQGNIPQRPPQGTMQQRPSVYPPQLNPIPQPIYPQGPQGSTDFSYPMAYPEIQQNLPDTSNPSPCIRSIVTCCSRAQSYSSLERCFELNGCAGAFFEANPCTSEFGRIIQSRYLG